MITKRIFILGVLFLFILSFILFCFYISYRIIRPYKESITTSPTEISTNYEEITITGFEGTTIKGWLFKGESDRLIIMVAGVTQTRINPQYDAINIARELLVRKYNVLMYDPRAHGESEGKILTEGAKEGKDLLEVIKLAKEKGYASSNIGILANSLGTVATLTQIENMKEIGAVVVDSPPARIKPIATHVLGVENGVPRIFHPLSFFFVKYVWGVDLDAINSVDHISLAPERVLLILHGEKDPTIPVSDSQEILSRANKKSKLIIFEGAKHIETYKTNPTLYRQEVFTFFDTQLQ